jgi:hypothetical protein
MEPGLLAFDRPFDEIVCKTAPGHTAGHTGERDRLRSSTEE